MTQFTWTVNPPRESDERVDWEEFVDQMSNEHCPRREWEDYVPDEFRDLLARYEVTDDNVLWLGEPADVNGYTVVGLHEPTDQPLLKGGKLLEDEYIDDEVIIEDIWGTVEELRDLS